MPQQDVWVTSVIMAQPCFPDCIVRRVCMQPLNCLAASAQHLLCGCCVLFPAASSPLTASRPSPLLPAASAHVRLVKRVLSPARALFSRCVVSCCPPSSPRLSSPPPSPPTPRLSTSVAKPQVQVVTHLCYSDFQDIMQAVDDMDGESPGGGGRVLV
jgi:hypothetical protein